MAQDRLKADIFADAALPMVDGRGAVWTPNAYDPDKLYDYTLGHQINRAYDFTAAVRSAVREFAPDRIIIPGPGTTLTSAIAQALIAMDWRGLRGKSDFMDRQKQDPLILSMAMPEQRAMVLGD